MPQVAKIVDAFREVFPSVTVGYAKEGDIEIGKPIDYSKLCQIKLKNWKEY